MLNCQSADPGNRWPAVPAAEWTTGASEKLAKRWTGW